MNARASRRRRRERAAARRRGENPPQESGENILVRLRLVRDQALAYNGRRRKQDLLQLEGYYSVERRAIWDRYHELAQAVRDGAKVEFAEPRVSAAPEEKSASWIRRLFVRRRRRIEVIGEQGPETVAIPIEASR